MSSVRELETRHAVERKKLMQVISNYLSQSGVKAVLTQEPALDSFGLSVTEPAIQLKEQTVDSIRLIRVGRSSCGETGDVLRFQYKVKLEKELSPESSQRLKARTKTIKEGKVLGLFGGTIVGVNWTGQELSNTLNRDPEISEVLLRCTKIWGEMEINIEASRSEFYISGPCFVNPNTIMSLYSPEKSYEEQNCVFGYKTIDRIAKLIRETALSFQSGEVSYLQNSKQESVNSNIESRV